MKCPHCLVSIHLELSIKLLRGDPDGDWCIRDGVCPSCKKLIVYLGRYETSAVNPRISILEEHVVRPKGSSRPPCPTEVTPNISEDYNEACIVLPDSPKASAALSRRCLQNLLREKAGVKSGNLADEIQQTIDKGHLSTDLAESIDAIRNIGNFSAHPIKSQNTGQIVPVEMNEAEWNLDVLESLFDFYFVQPAALKAKRNALNKKLSDVGKPQMK